MERSDKLSDVIRVYLHPDSPVRQWYAFDGLGGCKRLGSPFLPAHHQHGVVHGWTPALESGHFSIGPVKVLIA